MGKYEEALAKARAEYEKARKQGYTWLMALLEGMFPDLRESEDERVREAIIAVVQWVECFNASGVTHEDAETMLAWLEKQKDKRELDFAEGKVEGVKQTCQEIKDAMSLFEQKDLTPFEFTFRDYIDSAIRYCLSGEGYQQYIKEWAADLLNLEKQKEQKGANGNEKEIPNKLKPAGWSEEDEYKLNFLIEMLEGLDQREFNIRYMKELSSWLKSLHPQPQQEWSKEDEMYLSQAIETLEHENYSILADKLKSLRPPQYCENCKLKRSVENWKPSEEQMAALEKVRHSLHTKELWAENNPVVYAYESLIRDLHKLL